MRTGTSPNVFGASLIRIETSRRPGPAGPRSEAESTEAMILDVDALRDEPPGMPPNAFVGESETEILDAIRREAEELSNECHESDDRITDPELAVIELPARDPLCASEYELLDVDPESIDQYMNRLLARTQRAGTRGSAADPRQVLMPAFPADPTPSDSADISESPTVCDAPTFPMPVADDSLEKTVVMSVPPPGSVRRAVETRATRNNLREIVVETTRNSLVRQIRRRHQLVLARKVLVIFLALALASALYAAHFLYGIPLKHLAWGSTAIGMIALLGMAQIWSQAIRRQARLRGRISYVRHKS